MKRKILSCWEFILRGRSPLLSSLPRWTPAGQKGRMRHKPRNLCSVILLHFVCFSRFTVTFQLAKLINSPTPEPGFAETLSDHCLGQLFENNSFDSLVRTLQPTSKFHYWARSAGSFALCSASNKSHLFLPTLSMRKVPYWKEVWKSRPHTKSWTWICEWTWRHLTPDTLQNAIKVFPGNRGCCQESWSICYFSFPLSDTTKNFSFLSCPCIFPHWQSPEGLAEATRM